MTGAPQPRMGHPPPPYMTPGAQPQTQYPITTYAPQAYAPPQAQQQPPPNMQPPHSNPPQVPHTQVPHKPETGVNMRQPTTPSKY